MPSYLGRSRASSMPPRTVLAQDRNSLRGIRLPARLVRGWRHAAVLAFAGCCTYLAVADARGAVVKPDTTRRDFRALLEPLKNDLVELGLGPDQVLGYRDDDYRGGMFLHMTRLFLAPVRLESTDEHEWLLVVRVERPVTGLDRSEFQPVRSYPGLTLCRRRPRGAR